MVFQKKHSENQCLLNLNTTVNCKGKILTDQQLICPQISETLGSGGWVSMFVLPCHVEKKKRKK